MSSYSMSELELKALRESLRQQYEKIKKVMKAIEEKYKDKELNQ